MSEEETVYIVAGLGSWFALYAIFARIGIGSASLANRLFFYGVVLFTQGIPVLALVYPRTTMLVRVSSLLELVLAIALGIYLSRAHRAS